MNWYSTTITADTVIIKLISLYSPKNDLEYSRSEPVLHIVIIISSEKKKKNLVKEWKVLST